LFKFNVLTKAVGNAMCSESKRHKSEDGSWAYYAETESLPQISRSYRVPLTEKENNIRMTPTLT